MLAQSHPSGVCNPWGPPQLESSAGGGATRMALCSRSPSRGYCQGPGRHVIDECALRPSETAMTTTPHARKTHRPAGLWLVVGSQLPSVLVSGMRIYRAVCSPRLVLRAPLAARPGASELAQAEEQLVELMPPGTTEIHPPAGPSNSPCSPNGISERQWLVNLARPPISSL